MTAQIFFDDVAVGEALPVVSRSIDALRMFLFSVATDNAHRIHYDRRWAMEVEGYPDILVQGPLQSALMAQVLTDWAGPGGRLVRIAMQNRASVYGGEEVRFVGEVVAKREEDGLALVDIEIREEKAGGELAMPGAATVALPRRRAEGA